jgi:hypothetical protein
VSASVSDKIVWSARVSGDRLIRTPTRVGQRFLGGQSFGRFDKVLGRPEGRNICRAAVKECGRPDFGRFDAPASGQPAKHTARRVLGPETNFFLVVGHSFGLSTRRLLVAPPRRAYYKKLSKNARSERVPIIPMVIPMQSKLRVLLECLQTRKLLRQTILDTHDIGMATFRLVDQKRFIYIGRSVDQPLGRPNG